MKGETAVPSVTSCEPCRTGYVYPFYSAEGGTVPGVAFGYNRRSGGRYRGLPGKCTDRVGAKLDSPNGPAAIAHVIEWSYAWKGRIKLRPYRDLP